MVGVKYSSGRSSCGAAVVGGLYTLNWCGSLEGGAVADAAGGDADVDGLLLEALPNVSGAVDARVGAGLFGVDIDRVLSIVTAYTQYCSTTRIRVCLPA